MNILDRLNKGSSNAGSAITELNPWDHLETCIAFGDFEKHLKLTVGAENALKQSGIQPEPLDYPIKFAPVAYKYVAIPTADFPNYVSELARISREDNVIYFPANIRGNTYDFRILSKDKPKVVGKLKHHFDEKTVTQLLHILNLEDDNYPVLKDNIAFDIYVGCAGLETVPTTLQKATPQQWWKYLKDHSKSLSKTSVNKWMYGFVNMKSAEFTNLELEPYPQAFKLTVHL